VSRATVSQVLNNKVGFLVPQETRQRVLAAAQELGYVPNASARNLRSQKTLTIGVVIQDINNPFYPAFVRGVQDVAERAGYDVISYNTDSSEIRERHFLDVLRQGRVDGVVGVFWHAGHPGLRELTERGIPVAMLGQMKQGRDDLIDQVCVNARQAACQAVQHLLGLGHRKITVVTGPGTSLEERVDGYLAAMSAAGAEAQIEVVRALNFDEDSGYDAGQRLFAAPSRPTAVFAVNDLMALGLLRASREQGLRVPQDLALVGFDDIPAARLVTPALTTVRQFQERLGQRCTELLLERLDGRWTDVASRRIDMPYEFVVRDST
jgi:LacI family transcriptional regulator